jgi:hypothetical protein
LGYSPFFTQGIIAADKAIETANIAWQCYIDCAWITYRRGGVFG